MATFVQQAIRGDTGVTPINLTSNQTAGNTNLVLILDNASGTFISGLTDTTGNTYSVVYQSAHAEIWIANNIAAHTGTNAITPSGGSNFYMAALEISGLITSPFDTAGQATGTSTSPSASTTPSDAADYLVGFAGSFAQSSYTLSSPSPSTNSISVNGSTGADHGGYEASSGTVSGATSQTISVTLSVSQTWFALAATFKASGGGGGPTPHNLALLGVGN